jgi:hypothetical protein
MFCFAIIDMADDTQEMKIPLCTVFEQMHNLSGSTSNTCMGSSVGMVTNAMFWLDMATSQGLLVSGDP